MYLKTDSILFYFFYVFNDEILFPSEEATNAKRVKNTTFSALLQGETTNLSA
ncbi:hypothetical protein JCM6294_1795 [Bacteroides pyogenes DSM 20611 = JCM 6294]|uniref:Uncharacterized protein n=1 Tax=Bacteroides pyogenes DSM 20611 = JCM 6294 TaxID=1121100 RepID=W4PHE9_9BACE|nr:hypothetical protein JCM6294_1795 [Bacteroides pyogenes DSM 20611 = JCM 6294]